MSPRSATGPREPVSVRDTSIQARSSGTTPRAAQRTRPQAAGPDSNNPRPAPSKDPVHHLGRVDPAGVASAAHHIRRAEHDVIALRCRFLGSLHRGRKFRQSAAERAKPAPLLGTGIVVGQQRCAGHLAAAASRSIEAGTSLARRCVRSTTARKSSRLSPERSISAPACGPESALSTMPDI